MNSAIPLVINTAPKDGRRILIKTVTFGWNTNICQNVATGDKWVEARWGKDLSGNETWLEWCGNDKTHTTDSLTPLAWAPVPALSAAQAQPGTLTETEKQHARDCTQLAAVFKNWMNLGRQPTFSAGDMRHIIQTFENAAALLQPAVPGEVEPVRDDPDSKLVRKIQKLILEFEPRAALECIAERLSHHTFTPSGLNIAGIPVVIDDTLGPNEIKIVAAPSASIEGVTP